MIEIFETKDGYGYRVDRIYQEYDPDEPGFVPMTRERAEQAAAAVLARIIST